jgi:hypothetical protein
MRLPPRRVANPATAIQKAKGAPAVATRPEFSPFASYSVPATVYDGVAHSLTIAETNDATFDMVRDRRLQLVR